MPWAASDHVHRVVSRLPLQVRLAVTGTVAALARIARLLETLGRDVTSVPLAFYRRRSFYVMRNYALDRFGTRLEQRFTRDQIRALLVAAGFEDARFGERTHLFDGRCILSLTWSPAAPRPPHDAETRV